MIYLDHAATSFPKPPEVLAAVRHWFEELGVSPQRGDGPRCAEAAAVVDETRRRLGALCGMPAERVAFTSGATEALNLFLRGFLEPGDRVLTTALEHSSLVRPLRALQGQLGIEVAVLAPDSEGYVDPAEVEAHLQSGGHDLLAFSHASNVLGSVLDARRLCAVARDLGCASLVDASQTAGLLALDVGADAVVASAHKALLGPPGLGFIAVRPGVALAPGKQGGTGSSTALERHPEAWPTAFEAGTPNTPAVFGLHAALAWLQGHSESLLPHGLALVDAVRAGLGECNGVRLFGPGAAAGARVPIVSFVSEDMDPAEVGSALAEAGIHVRTGYHCAPWIHHHLGTTEGGTVRVSPGPFATAADVEQLVAVLAR